MSLQIGIVTLFPDIFNALHFGILGRAIRHGSLNVHLSNPRDYGLGQHQSVDDKPYGGGSGMVMRPEPLVQAIHACSAMLSTPALKIYLSPQGIPLTQTIVSTLAKRPSLLLVCGRYEGIDERVIDAAIDIELSIGDYVLSGGEFAACVLIDALARLQPNALGDANSLVDESFTAGMLEYPHYTRPENFDGLLVPAVLQSGNHQAIQEWRQMQALGRTWLKRPDLLATLTLTAEQQRLLERFKEKQTSGSTPTFL